MFGGLEWDRRGREFKAGFYASGGDVPSETGGHRVIYWRLEHHRPSSRCSAVVQLFSEVDKHMNIKTRQTFHKKV